MKDSLLIQPAKQAVSNTNSMDAQRAKADERRQAAHSSDMKATSKTDSMAGHESRRRDEAEFSKQFEQSRKDASTGTTQSQTSAQESRVQENNVQESTIAELNMGRDADTLAAEILTADLTIDADTPKTLTGDTLTLDTIKGSSDTSLEAISELLLAQTEQTDGHITISDTASQDGEAFTLNATLIGQSNALAANGEAAAIAQAALTPSFRTNQTPSSEDGTATAQGTKSDVGSLSGDATEVDSFLETIKGQLATPTAGTHSSARDSQASHADTDTLLTLEDLEALTAEIDISDLDSITLDDIDIGDLQFQRQSLSNAPLLQTTLESLAPNNLNTGLSVSGEAGQLRPMTTLTMPPSAPGTATVNATAIVNTVAQAILTAKETPQGVMVRLDPPEMGRVFIDFSFENDNQVNVVVKAESADSQQLLRDRSDHFMQMLQDSGFENVNLSFEQQSFNEGQTESDNDNRPQSVVYYDAPIIEKLDPDAQATLRRQINEGQLRLDMKL